MTIASKGSKPGPAIQPVFGRYAPDVREGLTRLRDLILDVAEEEDAGPLEETLKWGQPSYLTTRSKSGTTIRIDGDKTDEAAFALFVNCQTSLVEDWKDRFEHYTYGGNRSVHFRSAEDLKRPELRTMIAEALTYHRRKRQPRGGTR